MNNGKIYFVGIHHKPGLLALCSTTQSGKKIDAVIKRLGRPCEKVNLFSTDHVPTKGGDEYSDEISKFLYRVAPVDSVIVLLGVDVQSHFPYQYYHQCKVVKFRHPSFSPPSFVDNLYNILK